MHVALPAPTYVFMMRLAPICAAAGCTLATNSGAADAAAQGEEHSMRLDQRQDGHNTSEQTAALERPLPVHPAIAAMRAPQPTSTATRRRHLVRRRLPFDLKKLF